MSKRYVLVGYRLLAGQLVPDPESGQVEYSVDRWTMPPDGYVLFENGDGKEYFIPEADVSTLKRG